jgi:uncharacterized protein YndB with AHSA1/START domain
MMDLEAKDLGSYVEHDGRPAVRFERVYPHPVEHVWAAVTEPSETAYWFPSTMEIEPREGGVVRFSGDPYTDEMRGRVLAYDAPRRLAFTWGDDELHLELEAVDTGHCRFTLTDVLGARDAAARNAAGWSVCLGELDKRIAGQADVEGPHSSTAAPWQPYYDAYRAAGVPSGAAVPEPPAR